MKTSLLHLKSSLQLTKGLTKAGLLVAFSTLTLVSRPQDVVREGDLPASVLPAHLADHPEALGSG